MQDAGRRCCRGQCRRRHLFELGVDDEHGRVQSSIMKAISGGARRVLSGTKIAPRLAAANSVSNVAMAFGPR